MPKDVGGAASSSAGGCGGATAVSATPRGNSYVKRTADDVADALVAAYVTASSTTSGSLGDAADAYVHATPAYAPMASVPASGCARSSTKSVCQLPPDTS